MLFQNATAFRQFSNVNAFERFGIAFVDDFVLDSLKLLITRRLADARVVFIKNRSECHKRAGASPQQLKGAQYERELHHSAWRLHEVRPNFTTSSRSRAKRGDGQRVKEKLSNPFEGTQRALDNFTSWVSLVCAGVVPRWFRGGLAPWPAQMKFRYFGVSKFGPCSVST